MEVIEFYRAGDANGIFSNFHQAPITIDGKLWKSTEHYFQAMKFEGTPYEEYIRNCSTPGMAAKEGRRRDLPLRSDWEAVKDNYMRKALYAKFVYIPECYYALIGTGKATLVEHTKNDSYWGDGGNGSGRNMLGYLLMELRTQLLSLIA